MTCKVNEQLAFNTKTTKDFFEQNNIVALKADTDKDPSTKSLLSEFGNSAEGLPYYAIYIPGETEPIHFQEFYTGPRKFIKKVSEATEKAESLASKNKGEETAILVKPN